MATFKICIFKHHERSDGKFPVFIRVCWKRKYGYIKTGLYVSKKQIKIQDKNYSIKDQRVINELNGRIEVYEDLKVTKLRNNIDLYTARELAEYFKKEGSSGTDPTIDFVEFAEKHFKRLIDRGKKSTAISLRTSVNAMIDFCNGRKQISITEINARFLSDFETFLQKKRTLKRKNQHGNIVTIERPGVSKVGIRDYMVAIRTIFNAARYEYNDEDRGEIRIAHYPFRKYEIKKAPDPQKRALTIEQIRKISAVTNKDLQFPRSVLARDVFMLSFYLAGMNLADLYDAKASAYANDRLSYYRQKTRDRRQDSAYISISVEPETMPLLKKYRDKTGERVFCFANMYATADTFCSNVNIGLKRVAMVCEIPENISTYYARFSFATIARNDCGVSKDDINLSLDHVDASLKMADAYIKKDWSIIDRVIRKVINKLRG